MTINHPKRPEKTNPIQTQFMALTAEVGLTAKVGLIKLCRRDLALTDLHGTIIQIIQGLKPQSEYWKSPLKNTNQALLSGCLIWKTS